MGKLIAWNYLISGGDMSLIQEIVAMSKPLAILFLLGTLAGCTSIETGQTRSLANAPTDSCHGKPWSWCSGYHGDR